MVQGSVLQWADPPVLLYSGPAAPDARALMTVRASHDDGTTWRVAHPVSGLPAAYSDLVPVDERTAGAAVRDGGLSPLRDHHLPPRSRAPAGPGGVIRGCRSRFRR
ncbi:sialidase family protein [Acrocarpospora sp. B8E8]